MTEEKLNLEVQIEVLSMRLEDVEGKCDVLYKISETLESMCESLELLIKENHKAIDKLIDKTTI